MPLLAGCAIQGEIEVQVLDPDAVPFSFERVRSALFLVSSGARPDDGLGSALAILERDDMDCADFIDMAGMGYPVAIEDGSLLANGKGLLISFTAINEIIPTFIFGMVYLSTIPTAKAAPCRLKIYRRSITVNSIVPCTANKIVVTGLIKPCLINAQSIARNTVITTSAINVIIAVIEIYAFRKSKSISYNICID